MKDLSVKKIVLSGIALLTALFTLIGLAFKVAYPLNGFFFMGKYVHYVDDWLAILGKTYSIIHMLYGLVGIVFVVIAFFLFNSKNSKKINLVFVIGGLVFSTLYMVLGIIFACLYEVSTDAYGQFILVALCFAAYFICNAILNDNPLGGIVSSASSQNQNAPLKTVKQEKSSIDLLMEYKKLLDAGIISQEEFDAKKKELL